MSTNLKLRGKKENEEKIRCSGCPGFLTRVYSCENCRKPYHLACAKFKYIRVKKECLNCCRDCQASLRPPTEPNPTVLRPNSKKRRGSTNSTDTIDSSINNNPVSQIRTSSEPNLSLVSTQSSMSVNSNSNPGVSTMMASDEPTPEEMKVIFRELNSRMQSLDQIKVDVGKINGIQSSLGAMNANLETALDLSKKAFDQSCQNKKAISDTTAGLQLSNSRITQNEKKIENLYQLIGSVPGMSQSSNVSPRPNWDKELAVTGLSNEIMGNPMDFLRKLAGVLGVDFREHLIDYLVLLPVVKDKARVLIIKFVTKWYRDKWLVAKKAKRNIVFSDIAPSAGDSRIFLNERSTAIERKCFSEAKKLALKDGFKYCQMRTGQVYLKKDDDSKTCKYPQDFSQPDRESAAALRTSSANPFIAQNIKQLVRVNIG